MLTSQQNDDGLGLFVAGSGKTLRFGHDGSNAGYEAAMTAYAYAGKGAAIMLNQNPHGPTFAEIIDVIRKEYDWPDSPIPNK